MSDIEVAKQEAKSSIRNYTRTANILFDAYLDLHPQEKWLYINLVYLCGARGTRYLSIRYMAQRTGISAGALSGSKDPEKNNPGMIRNLHNAGLIHAEKKKARNQDGSTKGQEQYHITITDIWQLNEDFFAAKRSENERSNNEGVQNVNASVHILNSLEGERSENERERSEFDTNIRLHSNTTVTSKITDKQEDTYSRDFASAQHDAPTPLSLQDKITELQQQLEALLSQQASSELSTPVVETPASNVENVEPTQQSDIPTESKQTESYSREATQNTPAVVGDAPPSEKPARPPRQRKPKVSMEPLTPPSKPEVATEWSVEKMLAWGDYARGFGHPLSNRSDSKYQKALDASRKAVGRGITENQFLLIFFNWMQGKTIDKQEIPDGTPVSDYWTTSTVDLWNFNDNYQSELKKYRAQKAVQQPTKPPVLDEASKQMIGQAGAMMEAVKAANVQESDLVRRGREMAARYSKKVG